MLVRTIGGGGSSVLKALFVKAENAQIEVRNVAARIAAETDALEDAEVARRAPVWILADARRPETARRLLRAREEEALTWALEGLPRGVSRWRFQNAIHVLARLGERAGAAVPALGEVIRLGDTPRARSSIRVLTAIGTPAVVPALERGLDHESFRMVLESLDVIGKLGSVVSDVRPSLRRIAETHWSPRIRALASERLGAMVVPSHPPPAIERYAFDHGFNACVPERGYTTFEGGVKTNVPRQPLWTFEVFGRTERRILPAWPKPEAPRGFPALCFRDPSGMTVDLPRDATAIFPVPGGWLSTVNRGEFGGYVFFVGEDGAATTLAVQAFDGFVEDARGIVGIHGLCHADCTTGSFSRFEVRGGVWRITRTTTLPSAPRGVWKEADGTLLIATEAGVVKTRSDDSFELLGCTR